VDAAPGHRLPAKELWPAEVRCGCSPYYHLEDKMSVSPAAQTPRASRDAAPAPDYYEDDERGYGWVVFAGTLLLLLGTVNAIEGIAAIGNANFFAHNTHYVFANLNTWGWIVLILGSCQLLVGCGVFAKNQFSRWTGVAVLAANTLAQMLMMPAYPFWSLTLITMDILAIYGLIAYGKRISAA
jgi:hypothetical protein